MARYSLFRAKKGKTVMPSRTLQAKGKMLLFRQANSINAVNINYVLVLERELNLSSVMVLRKGVCYTQLCMLTQDKSTKL